MNQPSSTGPIWCFALVAYGLSWAGQIAIWAHGGLEGHLFKIIAPLLMLTPALAAFVAARSEGTSFLRLLKPVLRLWALPAAVFVPEATALLTAFAVARWWGGRPAPWRHVRGGFVIPEHGPFLWHGLESPLMLIANLLVTALLLSLLGGLLALGEEIGWRGYLQPRLCGRWGTLPGLLAVGLIWAYWHLPILLLGYVFPAAPMLGGFVLFPLIGVALSLFLGWLRISSGGVWVPALAHGSYNAFFGSLVFGMELGGADRYAYLLIVALTVVTGLLTLPLLRSRRVRTDLSTREESRT